jgi:hypothetical protein
MQTSDPWCPDFAKDFDTGDGYTFDWEVLDSRVKVSVAGPVIALASTHRPGLYDSGLRQLGRPPRLRAQ